MSKFAARDLPPKKITELFANACIVFRKDVFDKVGYYDEDEDGFLTNHEVGIFDGDGALLISTVLNAGLTASLEGHYRYNAVSPITISSLKDLAGETPLSAAAHSRACVS